MTKEELLEELKLIFGTLFNDVSELNPSTSADDIPDWDSLNHALLIDKIEKKYEMKFELLEVLDMATVGDICEAILKKQS